MLVTAKYKFLVSMFLLEFSESCKPSVEGETYVFRHVFKHVLEEPLELVWLKNSIPISTCRRNMACYDYRADRTVTTLKSLGDGFLEVILTIRNVTNDDAGTMNLKYLGLASLKRSQPLFTCTLQVYYFSVLALQDCLDVVEEGSEVQCLCKKNDDNLEDFFLYWFDHNGKVQNNGSRLLSLVAKEDEFGYTCRGWRSDGVESKPMEYRPHISKLRNPLANVSIHQELQFRSTDTLTYVSFTLILVMMSVMIVSILVRLPKDILYNKICSKSLKRLRKGRKMRSPFQYLILSPEDLKDCVVKINPAMDVNQ